MALDARLTCAWPDPNHPHGGSPSNHSQSHPFRKRPTRTLGARARNKRGAVASPAPGALWRPLRALRAAAWKAICRLLADRLEFLGVRSCFGSNSRCHPMERAAMSPPVSVVPRNSRRILLRESLLAADLLNDKRVAAVVKLSIRGEFSCKSCKTIRQARFGTSGIQGMDPNFSSLPEVTRDVTKSNSEPTLTAQRALHQCVVKLRPS